MQGNNDHRLPRRRQNNDNKPHPPEPPIELLLQNNFPKLQRLIQQTRNPTNPGLTTTSKPPNLKVANIKDNLTSLTVQRSSTMHTIH